MYKETINERERIRKREGSERAGEGTLHTPAVRAALRSRRSNLLQYWQTNSRTVTAYRYCRISAYARARTLQQASVHNRILWPAGGFPLPVRSADPTPRESDR